MSQSTTSTNSSSSTQSCKNESVTSSTSYKASSKKETEISKTKNEETTRQVEEQIPIHKHNYMERVIPCTAVTVENLMQITIKMLLDINGEIGKQYPKPL